MRQPNPIDFWRGVALVMIFINHVPGNIFIPVTLRNYAICDAAELFVFLAGWSISYVAGSAAHPRPLTQVRQRLVARAVQIYRWQLATTAVAVGLVGLAGWWTGNGLFYEWNNSGAAFFDPWRAALGVVLLSYQVGYFNILPLYVVLLFMAVPMVWLFRYRWIALLAVSLGVYGLAAVFRLTPPTWPTDDPWYLNPLSWQLMMVLGFIAGQWTASRDDLGARIGRWWPLALMVVAGCALVTVLEWRPDPLDVPEPRALFTFEKAYLAPARIGSLGAIVVLFSGTYHWIARRGRWLVQPLCLMGRHSLEVFTVSSILALLGQLIRFFNEGSVIFDVMIIVPGVLMMWCTARWTEWRRQ